VLFHVTKETAIESMLLAQRKDFWQLPGPRAQGGREEEFTRLEDLPD
jgi:hypothetical protein